MAKDGSIKIKGLYSSPNPIDAPEGTLKDCENVVSRRPGCIEPRNGHTKSYDTTSDASYIHYYDADGSPDIVWVDSDGTVYVNGTALDDALDDDEGSDTANIGGNLYFLSNPIEKLDTANTENNGETTAELLDGYPAFPRGFIHQRNFVNSTISRTSNVVTVTTLINHNLLPGETIYKLATVGTFALGNKTVLSATATTFTYAEVDIDDTGAANQSFVRVPLVGASGFLADGYGCAFKSTIIRTDSNQNTEISRVSPRYEVFNVTGIQGYTAGQSRNVQLTAILSPDVRSGDVIQLYRTKQLTTTPGEEYYLCLQRELTADEVSRKIALLLPTNTDSMLQTQTETLYTSPSQQGTEGDNIPPGWGATAIGAFGDSLFLGGAKNRHYVEFTVSATGAPNGIQTGDVLRAYFNIDSVFVTANNATAVAASNGTYYAPSGGTAATDVKNTALNLCAVINLNSVALFAQYVSGADDAPGRIRIESLTGTDGEQVSVTTDANRDAFVPKMPARHDTAAALAKVASSTVTVTTSFNHNFAVGESIYVRDVVDTTNFIQGKFTILTIPAANQFTYNDGGPSVTDTDSADVYSYSEIQQNQQSRPQNGITWSKPGEYGAFPYPNTIYIGSQVYPISALAETRTSVFAFKEDGLWRLTGGDGRYQEELFDASVFIYAPRSVVTVDNVVCAWTRRGVVAITDQGTELISVPIDLDLKKIIVFGTGTDSVAFGLANELNREYWLFTRESDGDTYAKIVWVYNFNTQVWTKQRLSAKDAASHNNIGYAMLEASKNDVWIESTNRGDAAAFADPGGTFTISSYSVSGTTRTIVASADVSSLIAHGDIVIESVSVGPASYVESVSATNIILDDYSYDPNVFSPGTATIYKQIPCYITMNWLGCKPPDTQKLYSGGEFVFNNAPIREHTYSFATDLYPGFVSYTLDAQDSNVQLPYQFVTGTSMLNSLLGELPYNSAFVVPLNARRGHRMLIKIAIPTCMMPWCIGALVLDIQAKTEAQGE